MIVSSMDFARTSPRHRPTACRGCKAVSTVTPRYPQTVLELPDFATDSTAVGAAARPRRSRTRSPARAYEEAGIGPTT